jgi:sucrose-phosphate synthase
MYIQLVSVHGLLRGEKIEMGRDADTGGQVRYVIDLARALGQCEQVEQVDLFTRRIRDKRASPDYTRQIEPLGPKSRLIRLPCGGGKYVRKERLWPWLDEFVDAMISFTRREGKMPAVVHGHYADAGYVAKEVAAVFDVPFVFTAHSLGKVKLEYLLANGWTHEQADREFSINHRIAMEQDCLAVADLVITSTSHERDHQYGMYHKDPSLRFEVVPPGTELDRFFPYYAYDMPHRQVGEEFKQARVRMMHQLSRFHFHPDRPLILALARPDTNRNIAALINAYGESKQLQAIANLAVVSGIREDFQSMPDNEQKALTEMLLAMDRYDLYGKMAVPKHHDSEFDIPELYRMAASSRGIFVNPALTELSGLTVIEASATGLPFVATENGGPHDIAENCESGLLVDVNDHRALTDAMLRLLTDEGLWEECSANGVNLVRKHYCWEAHCADYLKCLGRVVKTPSRTPSAAGRSAPPGRRIASLDSLLITDIDNTLVGDEAALEQLMEMIRVNRDHMGFGVASGRSLELVSEALEGAGVDQLMDVIVASVGSEIYYGPWHVPDRGWASQLRSKWRPRRVLQALEPLPFLHLQEQPFSQREFKISYDLADDVDPDEALARIHEALARARAAYSLVFSHRTFVDILPHRASKGKAVRYLAGKWNIPLDRIATAGDSGNDRDMLVGQTCGIVVANHTEELDTLQKSERVYFANADSAGGIIEGLQHYGFLEPSAFVSEWSATERSVAVE